MGKLASQRWKRNSGAWSELRCRGTDFPTMIWLNIRQIDTPQRSARSTPKPMIRRVNTSITTMTQWLRRSIRFAAEQIDARALSPDFSTGALALFIPWRVGAEESGAAKEAFGGALPARPARAAWAAQRLLAARW